MSAPHYVPADPVAKVRSYSSPPRRPGSWLADRPGEIRGLQPEGERLGAHGPDGGYALKLARRFEDSLQLHDREDPADVLAGGAAVAMKRAASFGRAPISEDLEVGLVVWGFLDANVDPELVELRREWFEEVSGHHHYMELRRVADAVPEELLRGTAASIKATYEENWRDCLDLTV
ncbi:MAG: hypothetical protein M9942_12600 [Microthrixaceae bacterium]|nr:hypothetical protein [Microthrixaceae bacterium]MCO5319264.1 hypothetical protein [Microthrixaceae bacterium]